MRWELDPDFALQTRLSFGRHGRYAWAMVAIVVIQSVVLLQTQSGTVADGAALLLSVLAFPYAAIQLLAQERGGRLELRRLTGKSAGRLSFALVAGASWMPLVAALVAYAVAAFLGVMPPFRSAGAMFMIGAAIAVVLVAAPRSAQLDPWMLSTTLFLISGAALAAVREWPVARVPVIVLAGVSVAIALPLARRRVQRPARLSSVTSTALRPVVRLATTRLPEFARALLTAGASTGAALFLLILLPALTAAAVRLPSETMRQACILPLMYLPVLVTAFQCSAAMRLDRSSGALDRMRLTGAVGWSEVLQLAAGYSLPFLLGWIVAAGYFIARAPGDARIFLTAWPALACLGIGAGLAEGVAGRRMGTYLVPSLLFTLLVTDTRHRWWLTAAIIWVPAAIAAGRLQRADGPALQGPTAVAAVASLAAILGVVSPDSHSLFIAGTMTLAIGFLVPDARPEPRWRPILLYAAVAALAACVSEYYLARSWINVHYKVLTLPGGERLTYPTARSYLLYAATVGAYAGAGVVLGWLLHNRFARNPLRSLAARASTLVVAAVIFWVMKTRAAGYIPRRLEGLMGIYTIDVQQVAPLLPLIAAILIMVALRARSRAGAER